MVIHTGLRAEFDLLQVKIYTKHLVTGQFLTHFECPLYYDQGADLKTVLMKKTTNVIEPGLKCLVSELDEQFLYILLL